MDSHQIKPLKLSLSASLWLPHSHTSSARPRTGRLHEGCKEHSPSALVAEMPMDDGLDPFDPCAATIGFAASEDDNDDLLRYLEFSDPDFPPPAATLPTPPIDGILLESLDAVHDPTFSDLMTRRRDEATVNISTGEDGDHKVQLLSTCEPPAAVANDVCVAPAQLDCSGCHVLREVVHTNGLHNTKLTIHGGLGVFYHATLDVYVNSDGFPPAMKQTYIDLSTQTFEQVKQFLVDYGLLRMRDRYMMIEDSLSTFYDALCVKLSYDIASTSTAPPSLSETGLCQSRPTEANDMVLIRIPKTGITAQRERTGKLHLEDLAEYFHLPIAEASKELKICCTAIKKICRRHGMSRWPHRRIKSIDRMISSLLRDMSNKSEQEVTHTLAEIEKLRDKRARICAGFSS